MTDWADEIAREALADKDGWVTSGPDRTVATALRKAKASGLREAADYLSAMEEMPRTFRDPVHAIIAQADKIERGCA
jgi:hypothetical protein